MNVLVADRPRDREGKFLESSDLGDKTLGLRLFKKDQSKFLRIAEEMGLTPTELCREAINEWLKQFPDREGEQ